MTHWSHTELLRDLQSHLQASVGGPVYGEIGIGPAGSQRIDVLTVAPSYRHPRITAYEVKISRADFQADVTAGKWTGYLAVAQAVIFAAPHGMIKRDEIPPEAGLIVRNATGWRGLKGPRPRPFTSPSWEFWLKLLLDGDGRRMPRPQLADPSFSAGSYLALKAIEKKFGRRVAAAVRDVEDAERRVAIAREAEQHEAAREADRARRRREREAEDAARRAQEVAAAWASLAQALGLPAGSAVYEVTDAIREFRRRQALDAREQEFARQIEQARDALQRAHDVLGGFIATPVLEANPT